MSNATAPRAPKRTVTVIALVLSAIYLFAFQAHLTSRYTPEAAADIEHMIHNVHRAVYSRVLSYNQTHTLSTALDLLCATLLAVPRTRLAGFQLALVPTCCSIYAQIKAGESVVQGGIFLGLLMTGLAMSRR